MGDGKGLPVAPALAEYLARHTAQGQGEAVWAEGAIRVRATAYRTEERPPLEYVTSVRGVVFRGEEVLVLTNRHGRHVVPGGRREEGETPAATLTREVLEEAGWAIAPHPVLAAVTHLRHLMPKPPGYRFPYPDFLWIVYAAEATEHRPDGQVADDYEQEAEFCAIADAPRLGLSEENLFYLDAALSRRAR